MENNNHEPINDEIKIVDISPKEENQDKNQKELNNENLELKETKPNEVININEVQERNDESKITKEENKEENNVPQEIKIEKIELKEAPKEEEQNINKEPININEITQYQNQCQNNDDEIKIVQVQNKEEQEQNKEEKENKENLEENININVIELKSGNEEENNNEKNIEKNDIVIINNQENQEQAKPEISKNDNTIVVLEENKNNLANEEMAQRGNINNENNNENHNDNNIINNEIKENQEKNENNEIIINQKQDQKKENQIIKQDKGKNKKNENAIKEKKLEDDFNAKDIARITELNKSNYKEFLMINHFCDYNSGEEWRSGFITNISNDIVELFDSTGFSCSKSYQGIIKIKISDSKNISYFRKHSIPDDSMVKGTSKNLKNKLSQFINFHNNFQEYLDNCDSFDFFYFLRATVYYGLDFCMNETIDNKDIETSFQLILIILNIICDCLKFIKDNFSEFLKYQNDIKHTQFKDLILIYKNYAIYSSFDDICILLKKIFGDTPTYLNWYIKFKNDINCFIPSSNILQNIGLYSTLFPLYQEQRKGDRSIKLLKKICVYEAYLNNNIYYTLDKKINSNLIAYFIDYFNFLNGYDYLFSLLCSIKFNDDNYYINYTIQYNIIEILLTAKALTDSFSFYNNTNIYNINNYREPQGSEKVINYMDEYLNGVNLEENENNSFNNDLVNKLVNKMIELLKRDENEESILKERFYIKRIFQQLKNAKKLEKSISLLTKLNNVIKSVEYNSLLFEIKEKHNKKYNELMLKDAKFSGRDLSINKMQGKYFCLMCKENNILELYLENKTAHEEIIKRIYPLLSIMYLNNFGFGENNKELDDKNSINAKYIFDSLFSKLEDSEKNNESLWKIILTEIILKFADIIKKEDKKYIFGLINKYYENTGAKKNSKIMQLLNFIVDYSIKCINSNIENKEVLPDLQNDVNNTKTGNNFDDFEQGKFNSDKFFCLELLINFLIEKDKINELQINDELKKNVINKCIDGIIEIMNKDKNNENIKQIIFIRIVNGIVSGINTIHNITLLRRIINLISKEETKNQIKLYCQNKKITSGLITELFNYIKTIQKETKENKKDIEERINLIFLLLENNIEISPDDFSLLFNTQKYELYIKKIIYQKIKENIRKINIDIQKYILDNILLKKDCLKDINDFMSYDLVKEFIIQINQALKNFVIILDDKEKEKFMMVKTNNSCQDIYGYQSLWNILLLTENKDIKINVSKFLTYIFLGARYPSDKHYSKLYNDLFIKIHDLLSKYKNIKEEGNINKIKSLVTLIKNIVEESNSDGGVVEDKFILEKIINPLKTKVNEIKDDKVQNTAQNSQNLIKTVNLQYSVNNSSSKNEFTKIENDNCEIYPNELFYHLRYYISYKFKIPVKRIQIKKYEPNESNYGINIYDDNRNIYDLINDKKKKKKEPDIFFIEKIKNPFCDDTKNNLRKLLLSNKNLNDILKGLLKEKNINFANDIFDLIKDKIEKDDNMNKEGLSLISDLIINYDKENDAKLNELFSFNESNLIYMNFTLLNIYNFLKDSKKGDIISNFVKSSLWTKKIKDFEINLNSELINNNKQPTLSELHAQKNYEINLIKIYKKVLNELFLKQEYLESIAINLIKIIYNFVNDCSYINFNSYKEQNDDEKNKMINIKRTYLNFFKDIKNLITDNKSLHKKIIEIIIKDNKIKELFEFIFLEGVIKNNYPLFTEQILDLFLSLIKVNNDAFKNIIKDFYKIINQIFFSQENKDKIVNILSDLCNNSKLIVMTNMDKYEYNLEIYFNTISQIFDAVYKVIHEEINFDEYIRNVVINSLFKPFLNNINHESNLHDIFLGGMCKILFYYLDNANESEYRNIEYYKGKNVKEYLYDELIMNNHENDSNEQSKSYNITQENKASSYLKVVRSFNSVAQLFIAFLIKEEYFLLEIPQEQNQLIPRKSITNYLTELNNIHSYNIIKSNQVSDWKIYFKDQVSSNTFIGLKNLGCTCYMNSLLQVFYNINLFRECLLKCKCKAENKNSLYEVQKIFFNLKYLRNGYYTPESFVNNYDDEILNPHQQMDVDEFFSNLLDKLENRIKNTDNENLIKYFFQGKLNDSLTFQEGCEHHRTNVTNFYSIQLQVMNKKNIYESLDTLTEGELMNGDNCIFCPQCNKKFPALKSQSFNKLPRILMFVLKRFEFNFDTMAKIKINDLYEFPLDLDMSKYIQNNDNNKYRLKSVVVHMGHSEGGHYYAYIKDEKSNVWHQFNDTSVTKFDIGDLKREAFGGKDEETGEEKNRSAYLLFYEKIDQTNCENFDKIKILNKLINLKNKNTKKEEININKEQKEQNDDNDGFNLLEENNINEIKEENQNNNDNKVDENTINENEIDEELKDMGGSGEDSNKLLKNINEQMKLDYMKQLLFSSNYHLFTLSLFLNIINLYDNKSNNLPEVIKNLSFIKYDHPFQGETFLFREKSPIISNIKKLIDKNKIQLLKIKNKKLNRDELRQKIIEIFKYILLEFFNIIIRSREKKYFGCFVELIKYLINQYDFCAEFFLEEFACYNTLMEYLINCPMYDIKKILVGLIYFAMIKSEQSYTKEQRDKNNKTKVEQKLSDEELAIKLQAEYSRGYKYKDEEGDEALLKKDISTPHVLKIVYNVIHILKKISFWKTQNESRFLFDILLKFTLISPENRKLLAKETKILLPLNVFIAKDCQEKKYTNEEATDFDKGVFKSEHDILNPTPGEVVYGDRDKTGKYLTLDYDIMLLCSLNYFKSKTKDEIKKSNDDIGFTFWKENYIYLLMRHCKTKQGIKYFSRLTQLKCANNKDIFDIVIKRLLSILENISDTESAFFDEMDPETEAEIYKNIGENNFDCSLKTLKKNVSFVLKKILVDAKNDKLLDYKIKTSIGKLYTFYSKNKKFYSRAITVINMLIAIFESINIDSRKYSKELNDILNWLTKNKIPPKFYEIKGMTMYKNLPNAYHVKEMTKEQRIDFDKKETENTNKKIEKIKNILMNKKPEYNIANFDEDLSDFKFNFGDVIIFDNKEYIVTNCLDEMIRVKLIEKNNDKDGLGDWDDISRNKKLKKRKMTIYEKEKISFWIETDNYKLKIKKLADENLI